MNYLWKFHHFFGSLNSRSFSTGFQLLTMLGGMSKFQTTNLQTSIRALFCYLFTSVWACILFWWIDPCLLHSVRWHCLKIKSWETTWQSEKKNKIHTVGVIDIFCVKFGPIHKKTNQIVALQHIIGGFYCLGIQQKLFPTFDGYLTLVFISFDGRISKIWHYLHPNLFYSLKLMIWNQEQQLPWLWGHYGGPSTTDLADLHLDKVFMSKKTELIMRSAVSILKLLKYLNTGNALGIWICGCRCILESSGSQNSGCT